MTEHLASDGIPDSGETVLFATQPEYSASSQLNPRHKLAFGHVIKLIIDTIIFGTDYAKFKADPEAYARRLVRERIRNASAEEMAKRSRTEAGSE